MLIIYARVSPRPKSKQDDVAKSITCQLETCRKYCTSQLNQQPDLELIDQYVSARKEPLYERENGQRIFDAMSEAQDGPLIIVAQKLDRVFRDTEDGLKCLNEWAELGIMLHLVDQGGCSINCATATGELIATTLLMHGKFESRLGSERTSSVMRNMQANDEMVGAHPKIGYMRDPDNPKKVVKDPQQQRALTLARKKLREGVPRMQVARELAANGYCGPSGRPVTREFLRGVK